MNWRVLSGDVRERLLMLPDASVQTCVTSPPYWGLRDYGHAGQLGLEPTPDAYVAALVAVFADMRRVLKDDGTFWLNLGDSYANGGLGRREGESQESSALSRVGINNQVFRQPYQQRSLADGLKPKDLVGIPWAVAFALRADGWYLRSDIIWSKPNPMPESVTDRPTKAHEYLFLLSKSERYVYDADAIAEAATNRAPGNVMHKHTAAYEAGDDYSRTKGGLLLVGAREQRNKRSVWTVATQPYPDAHFATFPEALIEPCILAGSKRGDLVLDPFTGSGTTGAVAIRHQRQFVGIELNPAYVRLARTRIGKVAPLFAQEQTA